MITNHMRVLDVNENSPLALKRSCEYMNMTHEKQPTNGPVQQKSVLQTLYRVDGKWEYPSNLRSLLPTKTALVGNILFSVRRHS